MGHPEYVNYPQAAVTVADATRLWNHGGPGANVAWNGTVEAVTYAEEYFAGQAPWPPPSLSVADVRVEEAPGAELAFTVTLSGSEGRYVEVDYATRDGTATAGSDYTAASGRLGFAPGETEKTVTVEVHDDGHDEGEETLELVLSNAAGAALDRPVATGTIANTDPLPGAWLARFGRTVAEQALDGIAGRIAAPRTPGMQGTIAGQALSFDPSASGEPAMTGASGNSSANRNAALAMAEIARGFDRSPGGAGPFGNGDPFGGGNGFGAPQGQSPAMQSRTMTAREVLLGSSFSLTGQRDGAGGSFAFWGRASQGSFDGAEDRNGTAVSLDGEVTTVMLGADYARDNWLAGLAITQSTAEGGHAGEGGAGDVEASLTAAIPYAALRVSERLKLWGAAGYGTGEVTLKTAAGDRYEADTDWSMAAAGVRGDLLAPPEDGGSGPALALTSDALWARTTSDKTSGLVASDSDVTRLRLGLEGSWHMALADGGSLVPKVEIGARHDGGDAETGFGVEVGGGIAWADPGLGLSLDLSGRTLLTHENDDLKDQGFSAQFGFDPAPATRRGPSLSLRQDFGGQAQGGLDALFAPDPLEDRTGSEATSRWAMEAAYGFAVFGGRFTGSPHVGLGLATGSRDYSVGWRLTPEAATAPDVSFGLKAVRREGDTADPEHTVGFEIRATW